MALSKVEICGVDTAKLPVLTNEEKETLLLKVKRRGSGSKRTLHQGQFETGSQCDQTICQQQ